MPLLKMHPGLCLSLDALLGCESRLLLTFDLCLFSSDQARNAEVVEEVPALSAARYSQPSWYFEPFILTRRVRRSSRLPVSLHFQFLEQTCWILAIGHFLRWFYEFLRFEYFHQWSRFLSSSKCSEAKFAEPEVCWIQHYSQTETDCHSGNHPSCWSWKFGCLLLVLAGSSSDGCSDEFTDLSSEARPGSLDFPCCVSSSPWSVPITCRASQQQLSAPPSSPVPFPHPLSSRCSDAFRCWHPLVFSMIVDFWIIICISLPFASALAYLSHSMVW